MSNCIKESHKSNRCKQIILLLVLFGESCTWSQLTFADDQWITDKKGCKVWNSYPASKESITWSGACVNGYANGYGILQWHKSGHVKSTYEGQYLKGWVTGKGKYISVDGDRYEGDWVNNIRQGKGKYTWKNGNVYDGDFVDGQMTGKGKLIEYNGHTYEGDFKDGMKSGKGIYFLPNNPMRTRYEGEFDKDKFNGQGIYYPFPQFKEEGIFRNGKLYTGTITDLFNGRLIANVNEYERIYVKKSASQTNDSPPSTYTAAAPSSNYTPSRSSSSSSGGSFLTGLLKTAVGVAVARQTGNNALGAQVALASPEELNGLTNQIASEARQHSDAEIQKKQAIRDQQVRQLQEQQASMQRAQQQASYGTVGSSNSSSSGSYSTINSSSSSSNNYGNSSSTINNGQNNSTNTSKPKKVAKSLNQCISFDRNSNSLSDFLVNRCGQKIWVEWMDDGKSLSAESVVNRATISKNRGNIVYAACPYGYSAYLPNAPQPSGYKWDGRSAFECRDW